MGTNTTRPTGADVQAFLNSVEPDRSRAEGIRCDEIFREVTGWNPVMWGPSIVGYGSYHYRYESGREGDYFATGFAPRTSSLVVYILPGYTEFGGLLDRLGRHRHGKSCLYVPRLDQVDEDVLRELIRAGFDDLASHWTVNPS